MTGTCVHPADTSHPVGEKCSLEPDSVIVDELLEVNVRRVIAQTLDRLMMTDGPTLVENVIAVSNAVMLELYDCAATESAAPLPPTEGGASEDTTPGTGGGEAAADTRTGSDGRDVGVVVSEVPPASEEGRSGELPTRPALDPPGTCHKVGCPMKGRHAPHLIGTPDSFAPYQVPSKPAKVLADQDDIAWLLDVLAAVGVTGSSIHHLQAALAVARNNSAAGVNADVTSAKDAHEDGLLSRLGVPASAARHVPEVSR